VASFNFKSSGSRVSDREVNPKITKKERDIGFKTPLTNAQGRQLFDMHTDPAAQLKDNLKNLILTNAGERLGLYDFGADLNALLFDLSSDRNVEAEFVDRINIAVQKYMPGIEIDEVTEVELDRNEKEIANRAGMAKIRLRIRFSIPAARIANQAIEVTLQAGG
jgi:phage baseplate assembly protein W